MKYDNKHPAVLMLADMIDFWEVFDVVPFIYNTNV